MLLEDLKLNNVGFASYICVHMHFDPVMVKFWIEIKYAGEYYSIPLSAESITLWMALVAFA